VTNAAAIRERFLRDNPSRRFGNLAANLARIESFGADPDHSELVRHLAEESAFFIEWAAPDATPAIQCQLLELQRRLVSWTRTWNGLWNDDQQRALMRETAGRWSQRLLQIAGLVPQQ
jgi:hypothetical protein